MKFEVAIIYNIEAFTQSIWSLSGEKGNNISNINNYSSLLSCFTVSISSSIVVIFPALSLALGIDQNFIVNHPFC